MNDLLMVRLPQRLLSDPEVLVTLEVHPCLSDPYFLWDLVTPSLPPRLVYQVDQFHHVYQYYPGGRAVLVPRVDLALPGYHDHLGYPSGLVVRALPG